MEMPCHTEAACTPSGHQQSYTLLSQLLKGCFLLERNPLQGTQFRVSGSRCDGVDGGLTINSFSARVGGACLGQVLCGLGDTSSLPSFRLGFMSSASARGTCRKNASRPKITSAMLLPSCQYHGPPALKRKRPSKSW